MESIIVVAAIMGLVVSGVCALVCAIAIALMSPLKNEYYSPEDLDWFWDRLIMSTIVFAVCSIPVIQHVMR